MTTQTKPKNVGNYFKDIIPDSVKRMSPTLPRLATSENENERLVDHHKPLIFNQQQQNNFEKKRRYIKSYTNNPSPEPKEITWGINPKEKVQSEPWKIPFPAGRLETKNDNFEQYELIARRYSQDNVEEFIKDYETPMILRTQSSGLELHEFYRAKTPIRIISTHRASVGQNLRMPRSITSETPLPTQSTALETEFRNEYLHTDRPSHAHRSPFIQEMLNPLLVDGRIRAPKKKNSLSPLQIYPRNTKPQQEEMTRLKTAVLDTVPLSKLVNENCVPLDVLSERKRHVRDQFGNNPKSAQHIGGEKVRRHKRTSSMELQSAKLPTQELQANFLGGRLQRIQRGFTETQNKNIIHVEDDNVRKELSKGNKVLTARLRPKFRGQEAILNKLFNQHSSNKK